MNLVQKEILDSIIDIKSESNSELNIKLSFSKNFIGFNGHFDEQPVLPAICLLEIIKCSLYKQFCEMPIISEILSAKFHNTITVKEKIDISIKSKQDFLERKNSENELVLIVHFRGHGATAKKAQLKIKAKIN